jgi:peptidyl-prolyl cis-trans isomerase SurA
LNKRVLIILSLVLGVSAFGATAPRGETLNGIAVIVNNAIITFKDVEDYITPVLEQINRVYGRQPQVFQQKLLEAQKEGVERLVERELILHDFRTAGYSIPEAIIEDEIQRRIRERYGDQLTLTKTLQAEGVTKETYRKHVRDEIIVEALRQKNVNSAILVSPHKIEAFYEQQKDKYKSEAQVKLRMMVLNKPAGDASDSTRKLAGEILLKLKEGTPFAELAGIYSEGSQRSDGGSWGWVERTVLRSELAEVAFSLKPGQLSGVIETPEACYLMLVEDARPAGPKPLADVREEIEKTLLAGERARLQQKYVERLKQKSFVRYF